MREKILLDESWQFHKGDIDIKKPRTKGLIYTSSKTERAVWGAASYGYEDDSDPYFGTMTEYWETVDLPHDYVILQTPDKNENGTLGYFKYENAWYRKHFELCEEDRNKRLTLYFEGISANSVIYVNSCLMKHNFYGYNSFEIDITDVAMFDKPNVIAVYIDASQYEGWWYQGAGIYRHVWLNKTSTTAVDLWGVYIKPQKQNDTWTVDAEATVLNESTKADDVNVTSILIDNKGNKLNQKSCAIHIDGKGKTKSICTGITVDNPVLWDIDNPVLYSIVTVIERNGEEIDRVTDRFGFRTIRYDANEGFFLNDKHIPINGVCCHGDYGLTGRAVSDNVARYRVSLIKEMGANAYRTAHYPHSEAEMDAFDEMGILVMDEARWFESTQEGKSQLEMLIKRDRNRPSVIMWSTGNEEPLHCDERGKKIQQSLNACIRRLDNSRPITTAVSNNAHIAPVLEECDIIGINYQLEHYEEIHKKYPDSPVFASECCATSTTRGWYNDDSKVRGYMRSYDHDTNEWFRGRENTWKFLNKHKWIAGGFQWAGIEHRGESNWPRLCSQAGAIDMFLQKKDAFYQNQAMWKNEPVMHLLPHWNHKGYEGRIIDVWVYTNCEETELFKNGVSLGRIKTGRYNHGEWKVEYESGTLVAVGYKNGAEVIQDRVETTGNAVSLKLRLENEISRANGHDIAILTCYCVDGKGRLVPDATPFIKLDTNALGTIIGTGSDVCDHVPVTSPDRRMRAGLCSAAIKVGKSKGALKVFASADGLNPAIMEIELN